MDEPLFDASSSPDGNATGQSASGRDSRSRQPFLGIRFECCKTYGRIYRNAEKTAYRGQCPRCFAKVTVPIGDSGTSSRFFTAH